MARYRDASCRLCRREGEKLFLKGTKCPTDKCAVAKREYAPGQHGGKKGGRGRAKMSNYAMQLREKQKAKRIYGMLEKQFRNYFERAEKTKGVTGEVLLESLERRLDNVVFRACFADSRAKARQTVRHRFVKINGKKVDIPSFQVSVGDELELSGKDEQLKAIKDNFKVLEDRGVPEWMEVDSNKLAVKILRMPTKADIGFAIEENLIVELYSK